MNVPLDLTDFPADDRRTRDLRDAVMQYQRSLVVRTLRAEIKEYDSELDKQHTMLSAYTASFKVAVRENIEDDVPEEKLNARVQQDILSISLMQSPNRIYANDDIKCAHESMLFYKEVIESNTEHLTELLRQYREHAEMILHLTSLYIASVI